MYCAAVQCAFSVLNPLGHLTIFFKKNTPIFYQSEAPGKSGFALREAIFFDILQNMPKETRSPIIVVVGHVDHGKTSLLDYIRKTNVVAKEAGGITQSIGAYEIVHNNRTITFIDTPGHEAFSKMRVRGAHIADIGILVVAADEGVKPQTKEALKALQDSQTPFVVALTKIDTPNADIERVKNDLTGNNVLLEGYGGTVSFQGVSSKTGAGIPELLDLLILNADVLGLTYSPETAATGIILEASLSKTRGVTVTVIVENGTLRKGDAIVTPTAKGKIKNLENFLGKPVTELIPSSPAVILGFEALPQVGEEFKSGRLSEEEMASVHAPEKKLGVRRNDNKQIISVILKADVGGSLEALHDILKNIPLKENQLINVISQSVGEITDGDVKDAIASEAIIVGFRTTMNAAAENIARIHNIKILTDEIIYKLVEGIEKLFAELNQAPVKGELEVLALFSSQGKKHTVGGKVTKGQMKLKLVLEIQRNGASLGQGRIVSLQQNKKDATVVTAGNECGLEIESNVSIAKGDILKGV